jgi:hypothetical protein
MIADGLICPGLCHTAATWMRRTGFDTSLIVRPISRHTEGLSAQASRKANLEPRLRDVWVGRSRRWLGDVDSNHD